MSHNKKSTIKRIGVKSAFSHGDRRLTITQFGRGNTADIAVDTDSHGHSLALPHRVEKSFTVNRIDEEIDVQRSSLAASLLNPAENDPIDYLGLKPTLEKEFFGQEFPNDSIRIQIIHNILDIQKILGIYINDILYSIANLQTREDPEEVLGQHLNGTRLDGILQSIKPYLGLMGGGFKIYDGNEKNEAVRKAKEKAADEDNKKILRILSAIRHNLAHYKKDSLLFRQALKDGIQDIEEGDWDIIDQAYEAMITEINDNFFDHSKTNLAIIYKILSAKEDDEKKKITGEYYNFSIRKVGKNLGINLRKLRELISDNFFPELKTKQYDSVRHKVYTILDFIFYRQVRDSQHLQELLDSLRTSESEEMKEEIYQQAASIFGVMLKRTIGTFLEKIRNDIEVYISDGKNLTDLLDPSVKLNANAEPLVKMLAFLCNFWDGKEVNEILSAYIHKFESVASFMDTLEKLGDKVHFTEKYDAFNEENFAENVADQLRVLASIGKMKPDLSKAKKVMYLDAIQMLGIKNLPEWLDKEGNVNEEALDKYILSGKKAKDQVEKKLINSFRNFIANNVIESRRFIYLTRYSKPRAVWAIMNHPEIVKYVLTRLPEKQIDTYYENIAAGSNVPLPNKILKLTSKLTGFSFDSLFSNREQIAQNTELDPSEKNVEIERLKALTGLYLTVAFVAVKNLVKANARYFIAFSAWERDYALMESHDPAVQQLAIAFQETKNGKTETATNEIYALTEYYLKKEEENDYHPEPGKPFDKEACRKHLDSIHRHFTKKWRDIFRKEIDEALQIHSTGYLGVWARNQAAHLNVLTRALPKYIDDFARDPNRTKKWKMSSYFRLYHYLLQRLICDNKEFKIPQEWRENILQKGIPVKDLIHVCYVPLGYNLARYKSLTIECLFDEDSDSAKEGKKA